MAVDGGPGREQRRRGQVPPLAAGAHDVEQSIQQAPHVGGAGRPPGLAGGISGSINRYCSSLRARPAPRSPTSARVSGVHIAASAKGFAPFSTPAGAPRRPSAERLQALEAASQPALMANGGREAIRGIGGGDERAPGGAGPSCPERPGGPSPRALDLRHGRRGCDRGARRRALPRGHGRRRRRERRPGRAQRRGGLRAHARRPTGAACS